MANIGMYTAVDWRLETLKGRNWKKRAGKNKVVNKRGKMWRCSEARDKPSNGNFAKVEPLVGSGT